jgi:L-fuculose-phosphate aldolase
MKSEQEHKEEIVEVGRRLYDRGFIAAGDGNISVRVEDGILTTPRSVCKGFLKPDMLVKVSHDGQRKLAGHCEASTELSMHLLIYELRPDVNAVVHAHPPCGTGYAAAGLALDKALISEVLLTLGRIPLAAYGTPSTTELTDSMRPLIKNHDALLMANHGAVAYGPTLDSAHGRMETLEHFARISLVTKLLGRERELGADDIRKLTEMRERANTANDARCQACGHSPVIDASANGNASCNGAAASGPTIAAQSQANGWENDLITITRGELIELVKRASLLARNGLRQS